ncbi:ribosomal L22e protein family-domain-containing protein [Russula ochroleuca]|uniref:Large ribosomal subunit protein eL22 n=1 Tax=Russula ochroleuca TaxID=152965 RepID=A0A9P5TAA8_9AGAM|nr:ribosomal L22e protein family-domain-containing protein [Russula ochroleuca]
MPKAAPSKAPTAKHKFVIDYSRPANDEIFDGAAYEKFLHDRVKVDDKAGQLGDKVKITRDGLFSELYSTSRFPLTTRADQNHKITVTANIPFSKRYLKYLTKKFLKKNSLRDYLRVVAASKDVYQLRFYNIEGPDDDEDE